jgi:hypothetical protein
MRKSLLFIPICIGLAIFFYPTTSNTKENGSPGGKTDSPMDGQNCTGCHGGTINSGTGTAAITTNIPVAGYVIGNTYTITLTGVQSGIIKFGFELTAESGNNKSGDFMITDNTTKLVNDNNAVTHKASGTSGSSTKSWSMDWTPTASSSGNTIFYAALMFANANSNNNGDNVFTTSLSVNEKIINTINNLPEKDSFTFNSFSKTITSNTIISIYDIRGKLVLITKSNSTNISHLKTGAYILKSTEKNQKIILN